MQVDYQHRSPLAHTIRVTVPHAALQQEVMGRLQSIARTFVRKGFRPGKAGMPYVTQRFGSAVWQETAQEWMEQACAKEVETRGLRPLDKLQLEPVVFDPVPDPLVYAFETHFETFPEFEIPASYADGTYVVHTIDMGVAAVEAQIQRLQGALEVWKPVDPETWVAGTGDKLETRVWTYGADPEVAPTDAQYTGRLRVEVEAEQPAWVSALQGHPIGARVVVENPAGGRWEVEILQAWSLETPERQHVANFIRSRYRVLFQMFCHADPAVLPVCDADRAVACLEAAAAVPEAVAEAAETLVRVGETISAIESVIQHADLTTVPDTLHLVVRHLMRYKMGERDWGLQVGGIIDYLLARYAEVPLPETLLASERAAKPAEAADAGDHTGHNHAPGAPCTHDVADHAGHGHASGAPHHAPAAVSLDPAEAAGRTPEARVRMHLLLHALRESWQIPALTSEEVFGWILNILIQTPDAEEELQAVWRDRESWVAAFTEQVQVRRILESVRDGMQKQVVVVRYEDCFPDLDQSV